MGAFAISPRFNMDKLSSGRLEDKIDVFEDQMQGWIFDHARALLQPECAGSRHSGLAVLMLACAFFEAFAEFLEGESSHGRSPKYFGIGFQTVFPQLTALAEHLDANRREEIRKGLLGVFYSQLRCGLFHEAMFRSKIVIQPAAQQPISITIDTETQEVVTIILSPRVFLESVETVFREYVGILRNPANVNARGKFEQFWNTRAAQPGAIILPPELLDQFRIEEAEPRTDDERH